MPEPYHPYVYDEERRVLVGAFEEMYRNEDVEHYDSWHQEDLSQSWRALVLALVESRSPRSILDVGCGKGAFTSRLRADRVVGVDVSPTALEKARARNPHGEFHCLRAEEIGRVDERFDLAVCLETLSYVEDYGGFLAELSRRADWLVLSLYLPPTPPIGYVKSFDDLRAAIGREWEIHCDVVVRDRDVDGSQLLVLAQARTAAS